MDRIRANKEPFSREEWGKIQPAAGQQKAPGFAQPSAEEKKQFEEKTGGKYNPESGLDKANIARLRSGKEPYDLKEWKEAGRPTAEKIQAVAEKKGADNSITRPKEEKALDQVDPKVAASRPQVAPPGPKTAPQQPSPGAPQKQAGEDAQRQTRAQNPAGHVPQDGTYESWVHGAPHGKGQASVGSMHRFKMMYPRGDQGKGTAVDLGQSGPTRYFRGANETNASGQPLSARAGASFAGKGPSPTPEGMPSADVVQAAAQINQPAKTATVGQAVDGR